MAELRDLDGHGKLAAAQAGDQLGVVDDADKLVAGLSSVDSACNGISVNYCLGVHPRTLLVHGALLAMCMFHGTMY